MNPNYPHSPYIPPQHYPHPHLPANGLYPYGLHHPPPYPYPPYPQYPPLAGPGGFPPPRPPDPPPPVPESAKPLKRKRKSEDLTKPEDDPDPAAEHKKRTKTQRACDSCRSRKIRCDVLPESDPPLCQHCKQYGFDCTFFLPITETRFKKKRLEEEAAAAAAAAAHKPDDDPPKSDSLKPDPKLLGPTSASFLLHSVPSRVYENYDLRHHHTWQVSKSGDGFIQVTQPPPPPSATVLPRPADLRIDRDVIERLVNSYFNNLAPIFTIVSRDEFLSSPSPQPVLLYAICSVAAANRDVPPAIFDSLRTAVSTIIKAEDVLSTASTVNLQALLVLGMCGDCHSQYVPGALSAFWLRVGTAIRMAQDLGLHRAESVQQNLDLRRRLWAACVITDRWCSLTYGHPFMIDIEDCDVRLTSSEAVEDLYMNELLKLSILLGRVLKMIYSPSGLVLATDQGLEKLLADMDAWHANLPPPLHFTSPSTAGPHAGLLHMFHACVCMLFWRAFMRISYTVPAHLKFAVSAERWGALVRASREAIEWLDANERMYDVWMIVSYCATSCALVQYHTWARRQDPEAAATLRRLRDCIKRWEGSLEPDHRSARRKTAEIIALLYESTQAPPPPASGTGTGTKEGVNPTVAVGMFKRDQGGVFGPESGGGVSEGQTTYTHPLNANNTLPNVNPTLNAAHVHVFSTDDDDEQHVEHDLAHNNMDLVDQFALGNNNNDGSSASASALLDGIPGSMFDWDQWSAFFARFERVGAGAAGQQEGQQQGGEQGAGAGGAGQGGQHQQQQQQREEGGGSTTATTATTTTTSATGTATTTATAKATAGTSTEQQQRGGEAGDGAA